MAGAVVVLGSGTVDVVVLDVDGVVVVVGAVVDVIVVVVGAVVDVVVEVELVVVVDGSVAGSISSPSLHQPDRATSRIAQSRRLRRFRRM